MHAFIKSLALIVLLAACSKSYKTKYPYSLGDFNPELRIRLERIVQNGGVCDIPAYSSDENDVPEYYDYLIKKTSAKDLYRLINCEHPVLRAFAFNCLVQREDSAINHILLDHLDDTAIISSCMGEFGESYTRVSDYFIRRSERNSKILKMDLLDKVITKHAYLNYAYIFIDDLKNPEEKYYPVIKQMAKNAQNFFNIDRESAAIRALARFNKREDIKLIAERLSQSWSTSGYNYDSCFSVIVNDPDTAYFKIIERYYRIISWPRSREEIQNNFTTNYYKLDEKYDSFLAALISFRNKKSSAITDTIVQRGLYPFYFSRREDYRYKIYKLLKKNECPEYKKLINMLKPEATAYEKEQSKYRLQPMEVTIDPSLSKKHDARYW